MSNLEKEFKEFIDTDDAYIMVIFNIAQELVQEKEGKEAQALNMIVGSSFALLNAIQNYKEIKNGKSIEHSSRTSDSKDGSRLSGSKSILS